MIEFDSSSLRAEMANALAAIRGSVTEEALRATGFAGAEVFREEAKRNAAKHAKTWTIYNNIIVKRLEDQSEEAIRQVYLVTVRKGNSSGAGAYYWRFVEEGHRFVPRNTNISKKSGRKIGWRAHRTAAALEYGTASAPAYPFMRPAYESKKVEAVDLMSRTLLEQLQRNADK